MLAREIPASEPMLFSRLTRFRGPANRQVFGITGVTVHRGQKLITFRNGHRVQVGSYSPESALVTADSSASGFLANNLKRAAHGSEIISFVLG